MQTKIAQVIDTLNVGGAERVAVDISNLLYQSGYNITIVTLIKSGELEKNLNAGIIRYNLGRTRKFSLHKMRELSNKLREFDIVHIHMRHVLRYVAIVKLLFPFPSKVIFHDHSSNMDTTFRNFVFKQLVQDIDTYIGTNQELCDWARTYLHIPENNICKLANIAFRQKIQQDKKVCKDLLSLVVVSNFRKEKNIEFVIEFLAHIKKSRVVKLDIYGQKIDNEYFNSIVKLINKYKLHSEIHLITDCSDIQKELYRYDMALHCSKLETGPLVLIEYMSQGLPFLTYKTGEVAKITEQYFPKMVISNFYLQKWSKRVDIILNDFRKDETKKELIAIYGKHFSPQEYLKQCKLIYKTVLNS